jgi:hypothetical protein
VGTTCIYLRPEREGPLLCLLLPWNMPLPMAQKAHGIKETRLQSPRSPTPSHHGTPYSNEQRMGWALPFTIHLREEFAIGVCIPRPRVGPGQLQPLAVVWGRGCGWSDLCRPQYSHTCTAGLGNRLSWRWSRNGLSPNFHILEHNFEDYKTLNLNVAFQVVMKMYFSGQGN